ncbi:hypothetical protein E8E13_000739 [Curvularia kusanoi]|uniref:Uncharacterized protein n=1 Tax=Curvularia kusanoi TaxID=90978 RepID=A0A9P4T2W3_CURKU|nr:hypothetical protein E8E13_000739 [Curvularia kusanoi]
MEIKDSYTLKDVNSYGNENFPSAFETINDLRLYRFESRRYLDKAGNMHEGELLHVAYWYSEKLNIPVWAHSDGFNVLYFTEKPGQSLMSVEPPFPNEGRNLFNIMQGPFRFVPGRKKPHSSRPNERRHMRTVARGRFALMVHMAFLMATKIKNIQNPEVLDLPIEIKDLCIHLHDNKIADNSIEAEQSTAKGQRGEQETCGASSQDLTQEASNILVRSSKRSVIIADSESDEPPSKVFKHTTTSLLPSTSSPTTAGIQWSRQPSEPIASIFETLVTQCKTEIEESWTHEKASFQETIQRLQVELAEERIKVKVAEERADEWHYCASHTYCTTAAMIKLTPKDFHGYNRKPNPLQHQLARAGEDTVVAEKDKVVVEKERDIEGWKAFIFGDDSEL